MNTPQFDRSVRSSVLDTDLSRRSLLRRATGTGFAAATAGTLLGVGMSPAVRAQETPSPEVFQGETYVGTASDPALFVAVVLGDGEARAYLCKTPIHLPGGVDAWLTGSFNGYTLDLAAESGAKLTGEIAHGAVTGTATLADGATVAFLAIRAVGPAGFYEGGRVDRILRAQSAEGGYLEELVAPVPEETLRPPGFDPERDVYPAVGIVVPPGGGAAVLQSVYDLPEDSERTRLIVLNSGGRKGAGGSTKGLNFSSRDVDWGVSL